MSRHQFSRLSLCAAAIGALAISAFVVVPSLAAEDAVVIPASATDVPAADGVQTAVVAGGCFWGVQGVFQHTKGVTNAVSGYAGGAKKDAEYYVVGITLFVRHASSHCQAGGRHFHALHGDRKHLGAGLCPPDRDELVRTDLDHVHLAGDVVD